MTVEKIPNYCTDQNIIVRYPNGAGGKFLTTCLFLFDKVAHWSQEVQDNKISHWQWFSNTWPSNISQWSIVEPNHPWDTNFFSRRFERGNDIGCDQYNQLVQQQASDYFFRCWNQGLKIVDHFHKKRKPEFQKKSLVVEIYLPTSQDIDLYKQLIKSKLWLWDENSKTAISTLDHPDFSHNQSTRLHRLQYQNETVISGYQSFDQLFEQRLSKEGFVAPFLGADPDPSALVSISLSELVDYEQLVPYLQKLEGYFQQQLDYKLVYDMHCLWRRYSHLI